MLPRALPDTASDTGETMQQKDPALPDTASDAAETMQQKDPARHLTLSCCHSRILTHVAPSLCLKVNPERTLEMRNLRAHSSDVRRVNTYTSGCPTSREFVCAYNTWELS